MKKYFINKVVFWNSNESNEEWIRGFYLILDKQKALLEVPSDLPGNRSILYEEEIPLEQKTFTAKYETGSPVHVDDGELLGELVNETQYYVKEECGTNWKTLLEIYSADLVREFYTGGLIYVPQEDIDNIEAYIFEHESSSECIGGETAESLIALPADDVDDKIVELIDYFNGDAEYYNDDHEEKIIQKDVKNFIQQMKTEGKSIEQSCAECTVYYFWNGSDFKRIVLEDDAFDTPWVNKTDEFEDAKEIDQETYDTAKDVLYRLKDGSVILKNISFYQGALKKIFSIDSDITTIKDARKYIENIERNY